MNAHLVFTSDSGETFLENKILSFRFLKDVYSSHSTLTARYCADFPFTERFTEVMLYVNGLPVHHGYIDSLRVSYSGGTDTGTLVSSGFTAFLRQNQMEPGLYTRTSLNSLMDGFYTFPHVTHEDNSEESYIYVKGGSTMWDGVVNLTYKLCGSYPYIRGTNHIMMNLPPDPSHFSYSDRILLSTGSEINESRITSDFHMADISGDYGVYELHDSEVSGREIVRHRYMELDRQFLYNPSEALSYYDSYAARGWKRYFCSYCGYNGEDLCDIAAFGNLSEKRISAVEIIGGRKGIATKISVYDDKFY